MKKGICLTAVYPEAMYDAAVLLALLERVSEQGIFDCVEFYFEGSMEEMKVIRSELVKRKLASVFLAGFPMKRDGVDITSANEEKRLQSVAFVKKMYEFSQALGAQKMLILSGPVWEQAHTSNFPEEEKIVVQAVKSLKELGKLCKPGMPEITLEFFNDEGEPWLALGKIDVVKRVFQQAGECGIGITYDTSHAAQLGEEILKSFAILSPWIHHLHLANSVSKAVENPLFGDKHPLFGVKDGDFTVEDIRKNYGALLMKNLLCNVDICSLEVISTADRDWYYSKICEQAAEIWKGDN